jgi:hypothetical protein
LTNFVTYYCKDELQIAVEKPTEHLEPNIEASKPTKISEVKKKSKKSTFFKNIVLHSNKLIANEKRNKIKNRPNSRSDQIKGVQSPAPPRFKNKSKLHDSLMRKQGFQAKAYNDNNKRKLENEISVKDNVSLVDLVSVKKNRTSKADEEPSPRENQLIDVNDEEYALFESIIHRELDANGGATIVSVSQDDLTHKLHMPGVEHEQLLNKFSLYFLNVVYSESKIENLALDDEMNDE